MGEGMWQGTIQDCCISLDMVKPFECCHGGALIWIVKWFVILKLQILKPVQFVRTILKINRATIILYRTYGIVIEHIILSSFW